MALVRGLHGVRGAVRVEVLTDRPDDRFVVGERLFREGSSAALTIAEARPARPGWVLRFAEIPTREAAEALRLAYLEVQAARDEALPAGAYFWHEMIGVAVRDPDGAPLGVVHDVYRAGGADVLEVTGGPRGDFDLPIARPFLQVLDPPGGEIVADPEALDLPLVAPAVRPPRPPRPRRASSTRAASRPAGPADEAPPTDRAAPATEA